MHNKQDLGRPKDGDKGHDYKQHQPWHDDFSQA